LYWVKVRYLDEDIFGILIYTTRIGSYHTSKCTDLGVVCDHNIIWSQRMFFFKQVYETLTIFCLSNNQSSLYLVSVKKMYRLARLIHKQIGIINPIGSGLESELHHLESGLEIGILSLYIL